MHRMKCMENLGLPVICNWRFWRILGLFRKIRGPLELLAFVHDVLHLVFVDLSLQLVSQRNATDECSPGREKREKRFSIWNPCKFVHSDKCSCCLSLLFWACCFEICGLPWVGTVGTVSIDGAGLASSIVVDGIFDVDGIQLHNILVSSSSNESSSHDEVDVFPPSTSSNDKSSTLFLLEST